MGNSCGAVVEHFLLNEEVVGSYHAFVPSEATRVTAHLLGKHAPATEQASLSLPGHMVVPLHVLGAFAKA